MQYGHVAFRTGRGTASLTVHAHLGTDRIQERLRILWEEAMDVLSTVDDQYLADATPFELAGAVPFSRWEEIRLSPVLPFCMVENGTPGVFCDPVVLHDTEAVQCHILPYSARGFVDPDTIGPRRYETTDRREILGRYGTAALGIAGFLEHRYRADIGHFQARTADGPAAFFAVPLPESGEAILRVTCLGWWS